MRLSLGLSTSWNAFRHEDAKGIVSEIKELGFGEIELSFNLTQEILEGIKEQVSEKQVKVLSLHNYCPIPPGLSRKEALPDCYSMSSVDEEERLSAVKFSKITIDTAQMLKARAVVLHCGRVQMQDATRELIRLYSEGLKGTPQFQEIRDKFIAQRQAKYKPFLENTLRSLEEVARHAQKRNVLLGVENRFYYREIPLWDEIGLILDNLSGANIYYWHDTGHAQLMENLGLSGPHKELLEKYGSRLLGMHIHDIKGCQDHKVPPRGDLDFNLIKPYLHRDVIRILEVHHPATGDEIKEARVFLEALVE